MRFCSNGGYQIWFLHPYCQIMENSSRNFSEIFIFWVATKAVLPENSYIFFEISILGRYTGRFTGKLIHSIFDWMSFPVKRPTWRPSICDILFSTKYLLLDEFSSKTVLLTIQFFKKLNIRYSWFFDGCVFRNRFDTNQSKTLFI